MRKKSSFKPLRLLPLVLWFLMFPTSGLKALDGDIPTEETTTTIIVEETTTTTILEETTTTTQPPEPQFISGLDYRTYVWFGSDPSSTQSGEMLSSGHLDGMNFDWGGGEVLDSGRADQVFVVFEGWVSPPEAKTYYICAFTDDGFQLYLDDQLVINDWWDRPPMCGGTADADFSDGQSKHMVGYYYENGGGAAAGLLYYTDNGTWEVIPDSWYTNEPYTPVTTTTTTTEAPIETTTTTEPVLETTTTTEVLVETTTTTEAPQDNNPSPDPEPEPQPEPEPEPQPEPTPEPTPEPQPTPEPEQPSEPVQEEPAPEAPPVEENAPEEPTEPSEEPVAPPVEEPTEPTPIEEMPVDEIINNIDEIQATELSSEQIKTVFSTDVLSELSDEQVKDLIETIDPNKLSDEQAEALSEALSDAPDNVKKEFENQINIFGGQFDTYVPTGSKLSVGQRRIIIAVTAALACMPAPTASRRK